MLVLTRKSGESVVIGTNIKLTVMRLKGNRVRLAIEAPESVGIRRGELEEAAGDTLDEPA